MFQLHFHIAIMLHASLNSLVLLEAKRIQTCCSIFLEERNINREMRQYFGVLIADNDIRKLYCDNHQQ